MQKWNMVTTFPKNLYNTFTKSIDTKVGQIRSKVKSTNDAVLSAVDMKVKVIENITSKIIPPATKIPQSKSINKLDNIVPQEITPSRNPENRPKVEDLLVSKATSQINIKSQLNDISREHGIFDRLKIKIKSDKQSTTLEHDNYVKTLTKLTPREDAELKSIIGAIRSVEEKTEPISKNVKNGNSKVLAAKTTQDVKQSKLTKETTALLSISSSKSKLSMALNLNNAKVDSNQENEPEKAPAPIDGINSTSTASTFASFFNNWGYSKTSTNTKSNPTGNSNTNTFSITEQIKK